jgi:hypothetical protein
VFEKSGGSWTQSAVITAPPGFSGPDFADSLDLSDGRLFVTNPGFQSSRGCVLVYEKVAGLWTHTQTLLAADGLPGDQFGFSLSASGPRCVVGSPYDDTNTANDGSVYVFERIAGSWFQTQKIVGWPILAGNAGWSVCGDGDNLGYTWFDTIASQRFGRVSMAKLSGGVWAFDGVLSPGSVTSNDYGREIVMNGNRVAVLEPAPSGVAGAAIDLFERDALGWTLSVRSYSGFAVQSNIALSATRAIVGSQNEQYLYGGLNQYGRVRVLPVEAGAIESYGSSCHGGGGPMPQLVVTGCAAPTGPMSTSIQGGLGGSVAVLLFGLQRASIDVGHGCLLQIAPTLPPTPIVPLFGSGLGSGFISFSASLPASLPPISFTMQAFCADPSAPLGFSVTNGAEISVP